MMSSDVLILVLDQRSDWVVFILVKVGIIQKRLKAVEPIWNQWTVFQTNLEPTNGLDLTDCWIGLCKLTKRACGTILKAMSIWCPKPRVVAKKLTSWRYPGRVVIRTTCYEIGILLDYLRSIIIQGWTRINGQRLNTLSVRLATRPWSARTIFIRLCWSIFLTLLLFSINASLWIRKKEMWLGKGEGGPSGTANCRSRFRRSRNFANTGGRASTNNNQLAENGN